MIRHFYDISVLFIQTSKFVIFFDTRPINPKSINVCNCEAAWASFSASFVSWACWKLSKRVDGFAATRRRRRTFSTYRFLWRLGRAS